MLRSFFRLVVVSACALAVPVAVLADVSPPAGAASSASSCAKYSGTVVLTYSNPDTIILHIIKGKVNAATTFTMTPSTSYTRNGAPAGFADVRIGDTGTITATAQYPSGVLSACSVSVTGA